MRLITDSQTTEKETAYDNRPENNIQMDLHNSEGNKNWNEMIQDLDKWHTLVMIVTLLFFFL